MLGALYIVLVQLQLTFRGFAFWRDFEAQKLILLLKFN